MAVMTTVSTAVIAVIGVFSLVARVSFAGLRGVGSDGLNRSPGSIGETMQFGAPRLRGSSGRSGDPMIALARGGGNDTEGRAGLRGRGDHGWNGTSRGILPELPQKALCHSIVCPDNYIPVVNAHNVECDMGDCTVDQCCRATCSGFPCPHGTVSIAAAAIVECGSDGCTGDKCCDGVTKHTTQPPALADHEGSRHGEVTYERNPHPTAVRYEDSGDEEFYEPEFYRVVARYEDSEDSEDSFEDYEPELYPVAGRYFDYEDSEDSEDSAEEEYFRPLTCDSIHCPGKLVPVEDAHFLECYDGECEVEQCCRALCSSYSCRRDSVLVADADLMECDYQTCDDNQCCQKSSDESDDEDDLEDSDSEDEDEDGLEDSDSEDSDSEDGDQEMCGDFMCPMDSIPKFDFDKIECDGECDIEQCCIRRRVEVCADYTCPKDNVYVIGYDLIICDNEECDTEQCCEEKDDNDFEMCADFKCPAGYALVHDHAEIECLDDDGCDKEQCCIKKVKSTMFTAASRRWKAEMATMCSSYTCPEGLVQHLDVETTECFEGVCDEQQCCMRPATTDPNRPLTPRAASPFAAAVMCYEYTCPNGYELHSDADTTECLDGNCDAQQCCEETVELPPPTMCSDYICAEGYVFHSDVDITECVDGLCDEEQCCMMAAIADADIISLEEDEVDDAAHESTAESSESSDEIDIPFENCSTYRCPPGHFLVDDAEMRGCRGRGALASGLTLFDEDWWGRDSGDGSSDDTQVVIAEDEAEWVFSDRLADVEDEEMGEWSVAAKVLTSGLQGSQSERSHSSSGGEVLCSSAMCCQRMTEEERRDIDLWGL